MRQFPPKLRALIEALKCLPGVGPKTAQRMALTLIDRKRKEAILLSQTLNSALEAIQKCARCRFFTENKVCDLCIDALRDTSQLCIVESPADLLAIEGVRVYTGLYFVLMGRLSPLEGVGPEQLGIPLLIERLRVNILKEVILATNLTIEGETTAHYLLNLFEHLKAKEGLKFKVTRIAQGVPMGGELEQIDPRTLFNALHKRESWFESIVENESLN